MRWLVRYDAQVKLACQAKRADIIEVGQLGFRRRAWLAGIGFALVIPQIGQAQEQPLLRLAPTSPWVIDYAEDSCALQRAFGEEGQRVQFEIRKFGPRPELQFIVVSDDMEARTSPYSVQLQLIDALPYLPSNTFNLDFGEGLKGRLFIRDLTRDSEQYDRLYEEFLVQTSALTGEQVQLVREGRRLTRIVFDSTVTANHRDVRAHRRVTESDEYQSAVRRADAALMRTESYLAFLDQQAAAVTSIALVDAFANPLALETGSLNSPMDAMDTCIDELLAHWGVDVEAHRNLTRSVEPYDFGRLVREIQDDYPLQMAREGMQGILRVRLGISADGLPTACHLQSRISDASFEETACNNITRHARFHPALDANGQAIASYFQLTVAYTLD